jgi:acetyltransferase
MDVSDDRGSGMEKVLEPRSVAVIGASTRRGTIGGEIFHNLISGGFEGPVYPVNPKVSAVQSVAAYKSILDVPGPVDLAVVVIPQPAVQRAMEECAEKGVGAAVIISAGYKETGREGARAEAELKALVRDKGIRLVGPNCLGVLSMNPRVRLNATFAPVYPPEGSVAIASQSGALGVVILDYAREYNIGISDFVSMGNKTDVSGNDLVEWWGADARTKVILLYLESFGNPRKFIRLARDIAHRKPIVAVKSGRSKRGSSAASSHTGALAGADAAVGALMAQTGVIRVDTVEELFHMAAFLAHQPVPAGNRVAIVTNAGGPGILATDACETWGLVVPDLAEETVRGLREFLPPEASVKNPVDMIASASALHYERAVRLLLDDPGVDAVVVLFVPPLITEARDVGQAIVRGAEGTRKPVLACFLGRQGAPARLKSEGDVQIPSYAFPETAIRVLARAVRYGTWLGRPDGEERRFPEVDRDGVSRILDRARGRLGPSGGWLNPGEVESVLAGYGIGSASFHFAGTAEDAVAAARDMGFPAVVKLASETLTHKSDLGGVRLDLRNEDDVRKAFGEIQDAVEARGLAGDMQGVIVQNMVKEGVEVIAGLSRDPLFGPLVMFGMGGVQVELMKDVAFRLHPLTTQDALEMIREVKGYPLLDGYRGAPPADVEALEELLLRLSRLAGDFPDMEEMDLNPVKVLARGRGCRTVDARIRLGAVGG